MEAIIPTVSVITITYNHETYITKTIEGVLMQQVNFPMEFIIAEDCSTDNTRNIVLDYANRYPELIKVIISESNVGAVANERRAMQLAKGKYIAFCEGDDYWTEPLKLQNQVDFLENHPDYSVTFHQHRRIYNDGTPDEIMPSFSCFEGSNSNGFDISNSTLFDKWITQYLTMVCCRNSYDNTLSLKYPLFRDTHQIYHLLKRGKGRMMPFEGGVYVMTGGGLFTEKSQLSMVQTIIAVDLELLKANKHDKNLHRAYAKDLQYRFDHFRINQNWKENLIDIFTIFRYTKKVKRIIRNVIHLYK